MLVTWLAQRSNSMSWSKLIIIDKSLVLSSPDCPSRLGKCRPLLASVAVYRCVYRGLEGKGIHPFFRSFISSCLRFSLNKYFHKIRWFFVGVVFSAITLVITTTRSSLQASISSADDQVALALTFERCLWKRRRLNNLDRILCIFYFRFFICNLGTSFIIILLPFAKKWL